MDSIFYRTLWIVSKKKRETFEGNIKGIGVGIPGPVTADGTVLKCANLWLGCILGFQ